MEDAFIDIMTSLLRYTKVNPSSMSDKAEARIEAAFNNKRGSPDPNGEKTVEVRIPNSDLDIEEVREVNYVKDVVEEGDEYRVYASADSGAYFKTV